MVASERGDIRDKTLETLRTEKALLQANFEREMKKLRPEYEKKVRNEIEDKLQHDIEELEKLHRRI